MKQRHWNELVLFEWYYCELLDGFLEICSMEFQVGNLIAESSSSAYFKRDIGVGFRVSLSASVFELCVFGM